MSPLTNLVAAALLVLAAAIPLSGQQTPITSEASPEAGRHVRALRLAGPCYSCPPPAGSRLDRESWTHSSKSGAVKTLSVRTTDSRLGELLKTGIEHSSTFRRLVTRLEESTVVAYVECAAPIEFVQRTVPAGRLVFVAYVEGVRYLAVRLDCRSADVRQLAALAHELQHAVEVADAPDVRDRLSLARLYRSIGFTARYTGSSEAFETSAAQAAGDATSHELAEFCAGCRTLEAINAGGG
jgi:hypothetical protein